VYHHRDQCKLDSRAPNQACTNASKPLDIGKVTLFHFELDGCNFCYQRCRRAAR
jgi:hypothetical protein